MRTPPPVAIDLPPERGWRGFQAALYGLAAAALLAWVGPKAGWAAGGLALVLVPGVSVAALAWAFCAMPPARLRWSGSEWLLRKGSGPESTVAAPAVMIDLGPWMLLRVRAPGTPDEWLAAARRDAQAAWLPFRAAVYSSAPPASTRSNPERPPS